MTDQTKPALPTLAEIEAMEALLGKATPGPWKAEEDDNGGWDDEEDRQPAFISTPLRALGCEYDQMRWCDANLVIALVNAAPSLLSAARELLAREARTILWVEAATDGLTNLYVRDGDRLRFGGAFTSEEAAIAAVTRTTSTLVEIDDLARRYEVAAEENAMLRAALAAKHRCDTPDCPNDAVVGLCWDHGLTPLDGATATLKVCLEAECVERQKAEAERDALREDLGAEQAKVAALEARLAEVGPVVEAAERQAKEQPGPGTRLTPEQRGHYDPDHLAMLAEKYPWLRATVDVENAVRAMLAARAKREVDAMGKGGTP